MTRVVKKRKSGERQTSTDRVGRFPAPVTQKNSSRLATKQKLNRLAELYPKHPYRTVARLLGRSPSFVRTWARRLKLKRKLPNYRQWTPAELAILRELYPDHLTEEISKSVGHPLPSTFGMAKKLGLKKSSSYLEAMLKNFGSAGERFRFKKGQTPANKGLRRPGWFAGRMRETQFKKGQKSHNIIPIGTVQPNSYGYLRIKVADAPEEPGFRGARSRNWIFLHRLVWEQAHGPIAPGYRIWWKDGDHTNCALENLELISGAEHMARTTIQNWPEDIKVAIRLNGVLKRSIRTRIRREEETRGEKQHEGPARPFVRDAGEAEGQGRSAGA